jgi:hypothetical protein
MGAITNFLTDKLQAKVAETLVDDTMARLRQRTGLLDKFMPVKTYEDDEFLAYVSERLTPVASFIAPGAEPPVASHGGFRRVIGELAKLGLSYSFDEVTQKQMRKAMEEATYKNASVMSMTMTDGTTMKGTNDMLVKYLYGHVEGLVQSHADRLTSMAWEVVQTGQLNVQDSRTREKWTIDFRRPGATYNHFPTALTNTGNTADKKSNIWTDYTNADGIALLEDAMTTYVNTNGYKPDAIVMSNTLMRHLQRQETTIQRARQAVGVAQIGSVGVSMLKEIMLQNNLPPIIEFDEMYQLESTYEGVTNTIDGYVSNARFLNENRFVFLKEGLGEQALGRPEESKQLGADKGVISGSSSVMIRSYEKSTIPILDVLQSISMVLPVV